MALHFELVTPAKLVRSENVHMVVVPGAEGEFEELFRKIVNMTPAPYGLGNAMG